MRTSYDGIIQQTKYRGVRRPRTEASSKGFSVPSHTRALAIRLQCTVPLRWYAAKYRAFWGRDTRFTLSPRSAARSILRLAAPPCAVPSMSLPAITRFPYRRRGHTHATRCEPSPPPALHGQASFASTCTRLGNSVWVVRLAPRLLRTRTVLWLDAMSPALLSIHTLRGTSRGVRLMLVHQ